MSLSQPGPRRTWWPFVAGAVVLLVIAVVAAFAVLRDDAPATTAPTSSELVLADGVTAGGELVGQSRALADALSGRGLECSARFTGADGGQAGCFTFRAADQLVFEVVSQYRPDGTVIGLNVKVEGPKRMETGPALKDLVSIVARVVFPADQAKLTSTFRTAVGGGISGSWGEFEFVGIGPRASFSASKAGSTPIKVPELRLDIPEAGLADGLRADGFSCTGDNQSCQGKPGLTVQMMGPDTGITYFVVGGPTQQAFGDLNAKVFRHLRGDAVEPLRRWLAEHLDGRSHLAYVAGWRVELRVLHGKPELTVRNDEVWLVPA